MPNLSAYQTALRASGWQLRAISPYKGAVAATFTVNVGYLDSQYPLSAIGGTYTTGSATDVGEGFLVEIRTSGGSLRGVTRTRYGATQTATSLKIRELTRAEIVVANGDVITIRREVRLAELLVAATSGFEPDMIAYSDQGENPYPVANSGGGGAWNVDSGQTYASVTFYGGRSFTVDPDSAGTMTHLWAIPSGGGSFAPGSASTDAGPTMRLNQGSWLIEHTVTDSTNSKSVKQYIPVVIHDAAHPPMDILSQPLSMDLEEGWRYSCQVFEDADLTSIPDGSLVYMWVTQESIGGTLQSLGSDVTGRSHIKFVGYIRRDTERSEGGNATLNFEIISPLTRLAELANFSKVMIRDQSPAAWSEIKTLKTGRAITQLIQYYSNWSQAGFDFIIDTNYTSYDYPILFQSRDNARAQIRDLASATDARFVCKRNGIAELQPVLNLLNRTLRNTRTTWLTLTSADWLSIEVEREHWRPMQAVYCKGFTAHITDPTPIFAKYPGDAPGHGVQTDNIEKLIAQNASDLYARCGRLGALRDSWFVDSNLVGYPSPRVRITLPTTYDVFDATAEWIAINHTTPIRGINLSTFRYALEAVNVGYGENGTAVIELTLQGETWGEPGTDDTPDQTDTTQLSDPPWSTISFDPVDGSNLYQGTARIGVLLTDSVYTTTDFNGSSPTWTARTLTLDVSEVIHDGIQSPAETTVLNCATSTKLRVYETITTTPAVRYSNAFTYAVQTAVVQTYRSIQHERTAGNANWIPVLYYAASRGLVYEGSTNGGSSLQSPVDIGDSFNYSQGGGAGTFHRMYPPLYVDPRADGVAYTIARDGGSLYKLFKTSNFGASWAVSTEYPVGKDDGGAGFPTLWKTSTYLGRPYQTTAFILFNQVTDISAANSPQAMKGIASTGDVQASVHHTPAIFDEWVFAPAVGGYAAQFGRRMFQTCDTDINKYLLLSSVSTGFGNLNTHGIGKVMDGSTIIDVVPWADYPANNWWMGGVIGGDGKAVYLWGTTHTGGTNNPPIGYVPNIDNWTDVTGLEMKKGTGLPASGDILNLFGF